MMLERLFFTVLWSLIMLLLFLNEQNLYKLSVAFDYVIDRLFTSSQNAYILALTSNVIIFRGGNFGW